MNSEVPKALHRFRGRPLIMSSIDAAKSVCDRVTVVVGHAADVVKKALPPDVEVALQTEQRGTGHAVLCALDATKDLGEDSVVVLPGDHPLVTPDSVARIIELRRNRGAAIALATVKLEDFEGIRSQFTGCGRIIRGPDGRIAGIVEREAATPSQESITEVNVSYYCFRASWLRKNVWRVTIDERGGEYYLTNLVAAASAQRETIADLVLEDFREGIGVNTWEQLLAAERC